MGINEKARGTRSLAKLVVADMRYRGGGDTQIQTVPVLSQATAPLSGTSGSFAANAPAGSLLVNTATGVVYINENTLASPYWTPYPRQSGLKGIWTDFEDVNDIVAIASSNAEDITRSGLRCFGQGWETADDSGLLIAAEAEQGNLASLTTTNEADHVAAISMGDTTMLFQPDAHETLVIDVEFTNKTAITDRGVFMGFCGALADNLDPQFTCATTVITIVPDDIAGMLMHADLTDGDGIFLPWNKSNENATLATTATGVDLSQTMPAAGTFTRWRVEISTAGVMTAFIDKAQVGTIAAALDADEEVNPVLYLETTATAIKQIDIRRISMWANR